MGLLVKELKKGSSKNVYKEENTLPLVSIDVNSSGKPRLRRLRILEKPGERKFR